MKHKTASILALLLSFVIFGCSKNNEDRHAVERRAQKINCVSNLKQIGIAFRIWAGDHGGKYPFQISTNDGGAMELVLADKDGFDLNAFRYLKTMTGEDELRTPLLLICPQDPAKHAALNWSNLQADNVSYRFTADTNFSPFSSGILAVCPVDGNVLYADGTVGTNGGKHEDTEKPFRFQFMEKQITNPAWR